MAKVNDQLESISDAKLRLADCEELIRQIYMRADDARWSASTARATTIFRSASPTWGGSAAARSSSAVRWPRLRVVPFLLPDPKALHIPKRCESLL
jgi:hypothetical protein